MAQTLPGIIPLIREAWAMEIEDLQRERRCQDRKARRRPGAPTPTTKPHIRIKHNPNQQEGL